MLYCARLTNSFAGVVSATNSGTRRTIARVLSIVSERVSERRVLPQPDCELLGNEAVEQAVWVAVTGPMQGVVRMLLLVRGQHWGHVNQGDGIFLNCL